jgi:hypothetical protein
VALTVAFGALAVALLGPLMRVLPALLPACPFKSLTGIPCATCGLTRFFLALSDGRWLEAFHWHPVAWVLMALAPALVGWDLLRAWKGWPYPPLPEHWAPRALVGALILGTWALQIMRGM